MAKIRLHKILADAGFGSRRACEQLILAGRITVNGRAVDTIPIFADPERDRIVANGRKIGRPPRIYLMLNKPKGVLTTVKDPQGRKTVIDLIGQTPARVFPVGRLDKDTQGLILLTNDGEVTKRLTHPRYQIERVYLAHVAGHADGQIVNKLLAGVWLSGGKARASRVRIVKRGPQRSIIQITVTEGKNRQVRRMLAKLALPVKKLVRIRFGPLTLHGVKSGNYRYLAKNELAQLKMVLKSR